MELLPVTLADCFTSLNPEEDPRFCDIVVSTNSTNIQHKFVILGCPQDIGVQRNSGRIGAAQAPFEIRKQFYKLTPQLKSYSSVKLTNSIVDIGNINVESGNLELIHDTTTATIRNTISNGNIPILLGGGHDCAFASGRAILEEAKKQNKTVSILNIDAHLDVRHLINGKAHSGSPFRQLLELYPNHISHFIEFGIQDFAFAQKHIDYLENSSVPTTVQYYETIQQIGLKNSLEQLIETITNAQSDWIHLSLDIDAVQSSYAPGVSAPAVVGFTPQELRIIIKQICLTKKVRLVDIVEVNPTFDIDNRTSKLAANAIATVITEKTTAFE